MAQLAAFKLTTRTAVRHVQPVPVHPESGKAEMTLLSTQPLVSGTKCVRVRSARLVRLLTKVRCAAAMCVQTAAAGVGRQVDSKLLARS